MVQSESVTRAQRSAALNKMRFLSARERGSCVSNIPQIGIFSLWLSLVYHTTPTGRYQIATGIQSEHVSLFARLTHIASPCSWTGVGGILSTYKKYKIQRGLALPASQGLILHCAVCALCPSPQSCSASSRLALLSCHGAMHLLFTLLSILSLVPFTPTFSTSSKSLIYEGQNFKYPLFRNTHNTF